MGPRLGSPRDTAVRPSGAECFVPVACVASWSPSRPIPSRTILVGARVKAQSLPVFYNQFARFAECPRSYSLALVPSPCVGQPVRRAPAKFGLCAAAVLFLRLPACKRSVQVSKARPVDVTSASPRGVLCVEQPDACLYCVGREGETAFLEASQSRPHVCDPKDTEECVEFCSTLAPSCALPWTPEPHCVLDSDLAFHRAVFNRDTADRPEVILSGRVTDEAGHRLEGVHVDIWSRAARNSHLSATKFRQRTAPSSFTCATVRGPMLCAASPRPGQRDRRPPGAGQARRDRYGSHPNFPHGPGVGSRGGAWSTQRPAPRWRTLCCRAVRSPEEALEVSETRSAADGTFALGGLEARRYSLRVSKFGRKSVTTKNALSAPAARLTVKLSQGTVIRGIVHNADGTPEPNVTVAAVLSDVPGAPTLPHLLDHGFGGEFCPGHFAPGTYYLWARRGDMLAYPPEKIELVDRGDVAVELVSTTKGRA